MTLSKNPILIQYPELKYLYQLEFKYVKPTDFEKKNTTEKIESLHLEAETQLHQYCSDKKFQKTIENTMLKKWVLIFNGNEFVYHREIS